MNGSLGSCFELLACVFSSPLRRLVSAGFPRFLLCVIPSAHERGALAWGGVLHYSRPKSGPLLATKITHHPPYGIARPIYGLGML